MKLSVIIPVLHEAGLITETVAHVRALPRPVDTRSREQMSVEIIVVDGSPEGDTLTALSCVDVVCLQSRAGRAYQMNTGLAGATGEVVLFLHVDTRLPERALFHIQETIAEGCFVAGAFRLAFPAQASAGQHFIARCANWRSAFTRVPYGDQALFFCTAYLRQAGGFAPVSCMEDVECMTRIRRRKDAVRIIPDAVITSVRRWQQEGTFFCTARNVALRTLYHLGVPPDTLSRFYRITTQKRR